MRFTESEAREQVERILSSPLFASSAIQRRVLRYLAEKSLSGDADQVKEYTIGIDVFGKQPLQYDPREDSIVRHQVGRVRQKLVEYYHTGGAADPVTVALAKGSFRVAFEPRIESPPQRVPEGGNRWRTVSLVLLVLLLCSGAVLAYALFYGGLARGGGERWSGELERLWAPFLDSDRPIVVCIGTPMLVRFVGDGYYRHHHLNEWDEVEKWPAVAEFSKLLGKPKLTPWFNFTGLGEAAAAFHIAKLLATRKSDLALARSSAFNWDQIATHNTIFVGPPKFNLQLKEIPVETEFAITPEGIRDLKAAAGKPALYGTRPSAEKPEDGESHSLISLTPGLLGKGSILLLAGSAGPDTLAAAEWLTDPAHASELASRLRMEDGRMPESFQVVLRVRYKDLVPVQTSYVLHRALKAGNGPPR
jgi:hypothetical protein